MVQVAAASADAERRCSCGGRRGRGRPGAGGTAARRKRGAGLRRRPGSRVPETPRGWWVRASIRRCGSSRTGRSPGRVACLHVALKRLPVPHVPVVQDLGGPGSTTAAAPGLAQRLEGLLSRSRSSFQQLDPRTNTGTRTRTSATSNACSTRSSPAGATFSPIASTCWTLWPVSALPTAESGGFAGRPGPRVPELETLYLAGDWVGPEGFLMDASVASARSAARLVLEDSPPTRSKAAAGFRAARGPADVSA